MTDNNINTLYQLVSYNNTGRPHTKCQNKGQSNILVALSIHSEC
jgi:hypothetical protein